MLQMGPGGALAAGSFGLATFSMTIFPIPRRLISIEEVTDRNLQAP